MEIVERRHKQDENFLPSVRSRTTVALRVCRRIGINANRRRDPRPGRTGPKTLFKRILSPYDLTVFDTVSAGRDTPAHSRFRIGKRIHPTENGDSYTHASDTFDTLTRRALFVQANQVAGRRFWISFCDRVFSPPLAVFSAINDNRFFFRVTDSCAVIQNAWTFEWAFWV